MGASLFSSCSREKKGGGGSFKFYSSIQNENQNITTGLERSGRNMSHGVSMWSFLRVTASNFLPAGLATLGDARVCLCLPKMKKTCAAKVIIPRQ